MEVIFNIIGSEVHNNERWSTWSDFKRFDCDHESEAYAAAYLDFEIFCAGPVVEWCRQHEMNFEIKNAHYAMQLTFIFYNDSDAMAFKLRWL